MGGIVCHPSEIAEDKDAPIYLDYNATTPLDSYVADHMAPLLRTGWGNPSSGHTYGKKANGILAIARAQIATVIGAQPEEIIVTSGGTESINHAIRGSAFAQRRLGRGDHLITCAVEHVAVLETCRYLERCHGFKLTTLGVNSEGTVSPEALQKAIKKDTTVISIMTANNEVGTIQPIRKLVEVAKKVNPNVLFHTDASQAVAKIPVDVEGMKVDLLTIAGHKLYAPKGIGALYVREGTPPLEKLMYGAGHENGRRAGTENVLLAAGLGKACELAHRSLSERMRHMQLCRDTLQENILEHFRDVKMEDRVRVNGDAENRLPNTLSISFRGLASHAILENIQKDLACSAGSACHSNEVSISHVLKAMNVPEEYAKGTLRLSTGIHTSHAEIETAADIVCAAINAAYRKLEKKTEGKKLE